MTTDDLDRAKKSSGRTVDFTTIVLSLRHVGLMALGLVDSEDAAAFPPDPQACRMQIDMLEVLKEKTEGNLTDDENKLLTSVLYELRMAFVEHAGKKSAHPTNP